MFKRLHFKRCLAMAIAVATSTLGFAQTQISDAAGLVAISNDLAGDYVLTADITLEGSWTPIGTEAAPFTGTFNGQGHTVKGLKINDTAYNYAGLFGYVNGGTLTDVRIEAARIEAAQHVGILVGRLTGGASASKVMTSGYVSGNDHVGGIAGDAGDGSSTISNCLSTAYVYSTGYQGGGIAGWAKGNNTLQYNLFAGKVYVNAWGGTGGIVGFYEGGTTTVTGNVCMASTLIGNIDDEPVSVGKRYTHAIAGGPLDDNSILVSSQNLVSENTVILDRNGNVIDQSTMSEEHNGVITTDEELKLPATYTQIGWETSNWSLQNGKYPVLAGMSVPFDGDYIYTVNIPASVYTGNVLETNPVSSMGKAVSISSSDESVIRVSGTTLTFVKAGTAIVTFSTAADGYTKAYTASYTITVADMDLTISTAADIEKLRDNPSGDFKLTADIDMTDVEFRPITTFSGSIDGQGHYIRNLSFNNANQDRAAFIAEFSGTEIKNLGIEDANIVGNANTAAFVGTLTQGTITNCVVSNSYIEGRDHVASFVGDVKGGLVTDCLSNAEIYTRSYQAGGIAGVLNGGVIQNCLFCGTVASSSKTNVTGVVSLLDSDSNPSTIQNCLVAPVTLSNSNGNTIIALAGRSMTLSNNYVTDYTSVNGVQVSGLNDADSDNGAIVTQADARSQSWISSTLGWDFSNTWKFMANAEGKMLPVLNWMNAPLKTRIIGLPEEDITLVYQEGTEKYVYGYGSTMMLGSWGQNISVTQTDGEDYAMNDEGEQAIWAGDEEGSYNGAGTAHFSIAFDEAINSLFTIDGGNTFGVYVVMSGESKQIATPEDFINIKKNPAGIYKLVADIDMAGQDFNGFCNDGTTTFSGIIDGDGHTVKNISLDFTAKVNESDKGLFGKTSGARISNISFQKLYINGGANGNGAKHVGLIGAGSATLDQVAIVGTVTGCDHVGMLAGDPDGITVTNSYVVGTVEAYSQAGGFFGISLEGGVDIRKSYSNVNVSCTYRGWSGGFVGLIDKEKAPVTITNCVSIGDCSSTGDGSPHVAAPFIAGNGAGDTALGIVTFSDNIYNSSAVMNGSTEWPSKNETYEGGSVVAAASANPATLQQVGTYTGIDWDFDNIWTINAASEYKYPVLKKVTVSDEVLTGIESVVDNDKAEAHYTVYADNNTLTVEGLAQSAKVSVYNIAGQQVANKVASGNTVTVNLPGAGVYVVNVAAHGAIKSYKLINK